MKNTGGVKIFLTGPEKKDFQYCVKKDPNIDESLYKKDFSTTSHFLVCLSKDEAENV